MIKEELWHGYAPIRRAVAPVRNVKALHEYELLWFCVGLNGKGIAERRLDWQRKRNDEQSKGKERRRMVLKSKGKAGIGKDKEWDRTDEQRKGAV